MLHNCGRSPFATTVIIWVAAAGHGVMHHSDVHFFGGFYHAQPHLVENPYNQNRALVFRSCCRTFLLRRLLKVSLWPLVYK